MKRLILMTMLLTLTASLALAQAKPAPAEASKEAAKPAPKPAEAALPTVDQVLDKYVTALGGKAALEKLTSRTAKGTFEVPAMGLSGATTMTAKAPNLTAMRIEIAGFGTVVQNYNGKDGWAVDPMSGVRQLAGPELAAMQIDADFYKDMRMRELYKKLEVAGKEKVGANDAIVVVATPKEGNPEKFYFDAVSGLLVRQDLERETAQGKVPSESLLEDYRAVDGVKVPFVVKTTTPQMAFVIKLESVKHNEPVDSKLFDKPAAQ